MRQMVDCFAEYERAIIRARTRAALAVKKSRGERVGGIPFGFQLASDGRTFDLHAEEQRALRLLRELRAAGSTYRAVAEELNRQGFRSRTGGLWVPQSVHQLARTA
jgi:DNA invertase Pin-like site-specific DNA recombinase